MKENKLSEISKMLNDYMKGLLGPNAIGILKDSMSINVDKLTAERFGSSYVAYRDITVEFTMAFSEEEIEKALDQGCPVTIKSIQ